MFTLIMVLQILSEKTIKPNYGLLPAKELKVIPWYKSSVDLIGSFKIMNNYKMTTSH